MVNKISYDLVGADLHRFFCEFCDIKGDKNIHLKVPHLLMHSTEMMG